MPDVRIGRVPSPDGRTAHRLIIPEGSAASGISCTRRLRLILRFPRGYWPDPIRAGAWALRALPDTRDETALGRAHPEGLRLVTRSSAGAVTLDVESPLLGLKYGVSWRLP